MDKKEEYINLLILSSGGLILVVSSGIGFFLGLLLDKFFNISCLFTIIFFILGTTGGFLQLFRMVKKYLKK